MAIGEDLRSWLLADSNISNAVGTRVHQNQAPQDFDGQFIWFARAATQQERTIDQSTGTRPFRELFDLEAVSDDIGEALTLIDHVRNLDASTGTFGDGTVQAVFVTDHSDDYLLRAVNADDGFHVAAVELEVIGYAPP